MDNKTGSVEIKVQVCVFLFDLLYLNGESLVSQPFRKRRELLKKTFTHTEGNVTFANSMDIVETDEIAVSFKICLLKIVFLGIP